MTRTFILIDSRKGTYWLGEHNQFRAIPSSIIPKSAKEMLDRLDRAGIPYEFSPMAEGKVHRWIITVPDDDPDAAFAFKMFVQP